MYKNVQQDKNRYINHLQAQIWYCRVSTSVEECLFLSVLQLVPAS